MATLTIQFWGLCLFVPDQSSDTMYVLMPAAGVPGGCRACPRTWPGCTRTRGT